MKIAIAAYGLEGQASYRYYSKDPSNDITIFDQNPDFVGPEGVSTVVGPDAWDKINDDYDLILRSPPISPYLLHSKAKVWSGTNEFFAKSPATIIGVTGTKGKGTTSSMIASILEAAGKKVWLIGNIGKPALDVLPEVKDDDVIVYEMSSFQLWDMQKSPHIAVVLPIEPDHLNVHRDMDDYVTAKGHIRLHQTADDICIYHPHNDYARQIAESNTVAAKERYAIEDDGGAYLKDDAFYAGEQFICSVDVMQVPGMHNIENACAAVSVALQMGISNEDIAQGLRNFKGLPHRLEFVRELKGVDYYNDSFSSAPGATIAAINAFTRPELLVLGGIDKGADFHDLIQTIKSHGNVKELVLIGEIRHKLQSLFAYAGVAAKITVFDGRTMPEIVDYLASQAVSGDVVLLSPGCASFDMFHDFYERGTQFRSVVNAL
jgi:UDP-N-acetylmuramoylalanine--D-glutamate ligase